jgi:hypothetical protein
VSACPRPCIKAGSEQKSQSGASSSNRAEQAKLASTLLEASKSAPKIQGKIVNDFGQEEVLFSAPPRAA